MTTPAWRVVPVLAAAATLLPACAHVKVDPIEVKEIHIVQDINIHVDKELEEYFAFQDHPATTSTPSSQPSAAGTLPTTQAANAAGELR